MTKKKAFAIAKYLDTQCDEAHIFVAKIGSGCLCDVTFNGNGDTLMSMLFTLLDRTFKNLKAKEQDDFYKLLAYSMKHYIEEEYKPTKPQENLSDKQRKKRATRNAGIIAGVESVL